MFLIVTRALHSLLIMSPLYPHPETSSRLGQKRLRSSSGVSAWADVADPIGAHMSELYRIFWTQKKDPIVKRSYIVPSEEEEPAVVSYDEPFAEEEALPEDESLLEDEPMAIDEPLADDKSTAEDPSTLGLDDIAIAASTVTFESIDLSQHGTTALLPNRRSKMLVRTVYPTVYDEITSTRQSYAVLGQPGIGKSLISDQIDVSCFHQERRISSVMRSSVGFTKESRQPTSHILILFFGSLNADSKCVRRVCFHPKLPICIRGTWLIRINILKRSPETWQKHGDKLCRRPPRRRHDTRSGSNRWPQPQH